MATTLTNLIDSVRLRLDDHAQEAYDTATGASPQTRFRLSHVGVVASSLIITVDSVTSTAYTLDANSGWVTFDTAPGEVTITFSYQYVIWTDARITEALNSAIDELFGKFYVAGENDRVASTGVAEILAQDSTGTDIDPEVRVTRVEYWNDPYWVRLTGWDVHNTSTQKYIRFQRAIPTGHTLRFSYVSRPTNLTQAADTLETTAGLPTRAKEPIVLLACSSLVAALVNRRVKDDRAHNTQSENAVKSYEIQNDAAFLRSQAEAAMSRLKMGHIGIRLVP